MLDDTNIENQNNNGWDEYRKLVLLELKQLNEGIKDIHKKIDLIQIKEITKIREDVAGLKVKAGIWGATAGLIPVAIMVIIKVMS